MPNWCLTDIAIHCDEPKIEQLENLIITWTSEDCRDNSFGRNWLGNIVLASGVGTVDTNSETDLACRGSLEYINIYGEELNLTTQTAWEPMLSMWRKIVDKFAPGAEIIYRSVEPGSGLYCTNDPSLVDLYIVDSWSSEIDLPEFDEEVSGRILLQQLQKIFNSKNTNLTKLIKMLETSNYSHDVCIHKWEYLDIDEWR